MARYHLLLSRTYDATNKAWSPWGIDFGDYDRETVAQEREDRIDGGEEARTMRLLTVSKDDQHALDAAVARLNAKESGQ